MRTGADDPQISEDFGVEAAGLDKRLPDLSCQPLAAILLHTERTKIKVFVMAEISAGCFALRTRTLG
jgi:hypothetical protein